MKMCAHPGCIAADPCSVHLARAGVACERCQGSGLHFYSGQNLTMACQHCGGTGLKDKSQRPQKPERVPVDERPLIVGDEP
jgi:DnaJ-class molecular chaperone